MPKEYSKITIKVNQLLMGDSRLSSVDLAKESSISKNVLVLSQAQENRFYNRSEGIEWIEICSSK
ncbi:MAG: hypothetical protein ACTSUJ_05815 [Candidatus Njordarchaeales archaeon]